MMNRRSPTPLKQWLMGMSLIHWERLGALEQWEEQDWPWQPGGRRHAGDSFPSRQDHGDEVGKDEGGDWDGKVKTGKQSGRHLADPRCS